MRIFVSTLAMAAASAVLVAAAPAPRGEQAVPIAGAQKASGMPAGMDRNIFHAQVLLDRAGFAPGVIDGKKGMSFAEAVKGFQTARGLEVSGELDDATRAALLQDRAPSTLRLAVDASDAQGPFVNPIPKDAELQAKLPALAYRNLLEKLAEKFHTTPAAIVALNDPQTELVAGAVLRLPNVLPIARDYGGMKSEAAQMLSDLNVSSDLPKADKIVVDKSDGVLRLYGKDDKLIGQFPATMGSSNDPLPLGTWKALTVAYNPPFHYQPDLFWDVADDKAEQRLPPGPNGPVGVVWIDLSKEHYGIHGTSAPETIQRAQSHGCVRLTNWDAAKVARMVTDGMAVVFQA